MPQMSPLLWTNLFIFFILTFLLIVIINFFSKPPVKIQAPSITHKMHKPIWKW